MNTYAILSGSSPKGFYQQKLVSMHDFLISKGNCCVPEKNIIIFPNGVNELLLESALNTAFDWAEEDYGREVLLYFCTRTEKDLNAELLDSFIPCIKVLKLGESEIRIQRKSCETD